MEALKAALKLSLFFGSTFIFVQTVYKRGDVILQCTMHETKVKEDGIDDEKVM